MRPHSSPVGWLRALLYRSANMTAPVRNGPTTPARKKRRLSAAGRWCNHRGDEKTVGGRRGRVSDCRPSPPPASQHRSTCSADEKQHVYVYSKNQS
jgi:hypothetical protein